MLLLNRKDIQSVFTMKESIEAVKKSIYVVLSGKK